jgi:hypothetical protein
MIFDRTDNIYLNTNKDVQNKSWIPYFTWAKYDITYADKYL